MKFISSELIFLYRFHHFFFFKSTSLSKIFYWRKNYSKQLDDTLNLVLNTFSSIFISLYGTNIGTGRSIIETLSTVLPKISAIFNDVLISFNFLLSDPFAILSGPISTIFILLIFDINLINLVLSTLLNDVK